MNIHSNEFPYKIFRKVETPFDKHAIFMRIQRDNTRANKDLYVYIGQGMADLLCLLEADIGIVFGSSVSLREVGKHYGVEFVQLYHGLVKKIKALDQDWKPRSGILYTVDSWAEIEAFILGF